METSVNLEKAVFKVREQKNLMIIIGKTLEIRSFVYRINICKKE